MSHTMVTMMGHCGHGMVAMVVTWCPTLGCTMMAMMGHVGHGMVAMRVTWCHIG